MKVVFFGTPHFVVPVAEVLKKNFDLVGIVTTPDEKIGRKQIMTPTAVKLYAQTSNIPTFTPEQLNNEAVKQLQQLSPDLFLVAAYGKIIPQEILNIPKYGAINIHPSKLPELRGPSPIQTTILNGITNSAITFIKVDADVDHGPIIAQKSVEINSKETFEDLAIRLFNKSSELLPKVIEDYTSGKITPREQSHEDATFCDHINKEDGYFDSDNPPSPDKLDCMIRAYFPWPTAWTRVKIKNNESGIMKLLPENRIQVEGGKPMTVKDFVNGYPELRVTVEKFFA